MLDSSVQQSDSVVHIYVCIYTLFFKFCSNMAYKGFPGGSDSKESVCSSGDPGSIPGLGRSPGEGNGNWLQYSCLENAMDRGAWQVTVCGAAKSRTQLSDFTSLHFPSSWNSFRAIKVKWVSCYSSQAPSHHNWVYVTAGHFWKPPKDGGWLSRKLIMNRGLEVSVSLPGSPGRGEWLEVE